MQSWKEISTTFKKEIALYRAILQDKRTPKLAHFFLSCAVGYLFLPFDLIPDFIPVLGQLDDLIIIPLLIWLAFRYIPNELVEDVKSQLKN